MPDQGVGSSPEAVSLLLDLLELPEALISGEAAELRKAAVTTLVEQGLLVQHDYEDVVTSTANHEDLPVPLFWSDRTDGLSYFDPFRGLTPVTSDRLQRRRVETDALLARLASSMSMLPPHVPIELLDGRLWEMGNARLTGRSSPISVWFARRLWDRAVQRDTAAKAKARPTRTRRVILTSSPASRVGDVSIEGAIIVPLADVLIHPGDLVVSPDILSAMVSGITRDVSSECIQLSADGTQLRIENGAVVTLNSKTQIEAIRKLVSAFNRGEWVAIRDLTPHGTLGRLFGQKKWKVLSVHIKGHKGFWGFEL